MFNPEDVLHFWFGPVDADGRSDDAHSARWFSKHPELDREIRERFGPVHDAIGRGELDSWLETPRGRLAYVIVLDQFSRNMFRGSPLAFAEDARALRAAMDGIEKGVDRSLSVQERLFMYMPLMHAEDLATQERCVKLFTALRDELPPEQRDRVAVNVEYAKQHRDIIARFGRFPHRNAILGRAHAPEEDEFLKQPGSSF